MKRRHAPQARQMLQNNLAGSNERTAYDTALATLQSFMSIAVTINLQVLNRVIAMLETRAGWFRVMTLQAKVKLKG